MSLPAGWSWVSLGDVATSVKNGIYVSRASSTPNGVPILRISAVRPMRLTTSDLRYTGMTQEEVEASDGIARPGDLLFTRYNGNVSLVGACARIPDKSPIFAYPDKLIRVRLPSAIDSHFVCYAWAWSGVNQQLRRHVKTTAGQAGISGASLKRIKIPIAPLAEQHRIVEALEDHLSRLDAATQSLIAAESRISSLRASLLTSLLGPAIGSDDRWDFLTIGEIATVGTGSTPLKSRVDYYEGGTIPWVTSSLLNSPFIENPDKYITSKAVEENSVKVYPPGTILIAMYGEGKTRGMSAELGFSAATNQACAAIVLHEKNQFRKPWIKLALEFQYHKMRQLSAGGVQQNLNLSLIRGIEIPLPPAAEQQRLLAELDVWSTGINRLRSSTALLQLRSRRLRTLLVERAFCGKLVPQNVDDEPAAAALNRIRAERDGEGNKPKRARRRKHEDPATGVTKPPPPTRSSAIPMTAVQQELPL